MYFLHVLPVSETSLGEYIITLRPYLIKVHCFTGDERFLLGRSVITDPVGDRPKRFGGRLIPVQQVGVRGMVRPVRLPRFISVVIVGEDTLGVGDKAVEGGLGVND